MKFDPSNQGSGREWGARAESSVRLPRGPVGHAQGWLHLLGRNGSAYQCELNLIGPLQPSHLRSAINRWTEAEERPLAKRSKGRRPSARRPPERPTVRQNRRSMWTNRLRCRQWPGIRVIIITQVKMKIAIRRQVCVKRFNHFMV